MKKVILILTPLLLIGTAAALAFLGIINVPGITPHKKQKPVAKSADRPAPAPVVAKKEPEQSKAVTPTPAPVVVAAKPKPEQVQDRDQGARTLAKLWNEVDSKKLVDLVKDWKDVEVARVFAQMDPDKVAEVLGQMEAKRASKISTEVEKEASIVKNET